MAINPDLNFFEVGRDVAHRTWKAWKARHRFSFGTWDFLLSYLKPGYFSLRLKNEAWLKRAKDLEKSYPEVFYMFCRFMKLKYQLADPLGGVQTCGIDVTARALVKSSQYRYLPQNVNLAVLDAREIPSMDPLEKVAALEPFLSFLQEKIDPKMTEPNVWLFILRGRDDVKVALKFVTYKLKEYDYKKFLYVPSKGEMMGSSTTRTIASDVPLFFLFKKGNAFATKVRDNIKAEYDTPASCMYYTDASKNIEAKWRIQATELRMEFYLQILQDFAMPDENVLGLYTGPKFMLASKVCFLPL